ncbi:protein maelstrom 1 isoform X2 [Cylas formicarius]|uniref:protein maelstrom 1 isoform X2 n=1 Tax=Cylas formicarius TaxID=197179 RepID=UPI0029589AB0|nr:protein maelstrom 1 isoform X2 [Cylas formicarius]
MPPKKPPAPNAFSMFVMDFKNQQGMKFSSTKEAYEAAGPFWARMSAAERRPYQEQAKREKKPGKYTSEGLNVEDLTRKQREEAEFQDQMRQNIRQTIDLANMKGPEALANETFFIIHFNIFCYHQSSNQYYPAEVAAVCFNLKDGVKAGNVFHEFILPGPLPLGYSFEARQHSDETHQIAVPYEDVENNMEEVFAKLVTFLEKKKPEGNILDRWSFDYEGDESLFRVYSLQVLFFSLRNRVSGGEVWPTYTFSDREIEKDVYAYDPDIACDYHSATSKPLYCSKSTVLRMVYIICDHCCEELDIELLPGQHVPLRSAVPLGAPSVHSFNSLTSRSSRWGLGSEYDGDSTTDWENKSLISESSVTTVDFPPLGRNEANSDPFPSLPQSNSSAIRNYSDSLGSKAMPSAFENAHCKGRGFRKRDDDCSSTASSAVSGVWRGYESSRSVHVAPRGRGIRRGAVTKPGPAN